MISCAYALLFSGYRLPDSPSSFYSSRQKAKEPTRDDVLKGLSFSRGWVGKFFPPDGQFPRPDAKFDIVKTQESRYDTRTKVVAYCSPTLSSMKIIETFKYDVSPMSQIYYTESVPITTSERNCQDQIEEDWYELLENSSIWSKELVQNSSCSSRDIISLAHRGLLLVTGVYSEMAPTYTKKNTKANTKKYLEPVNEVEVPKVNIRDSVDLHQMVSSEQIFGTWKYRTQMALVWYFGHLHLFERKIGSTTWWPKTKIEVEHGNGAILLNSMRYHMNLFKKLDDKIAEYGLLYRAVNIIPCSSCIPLDTQDKSDHIMAEIRHLVIERRRAPHYSFLLDNF
ncbi:putative effector protein [Blumeria hordei DH14]|uniref:Putative effector protein n=1 Tax=Blumeria graminis f. sp. hordei (strain DH14) TaxID=546991 RepID=N1JC66_BLUG1|nr:putative effector protein [Blumeria hordei DH14]